MRYFSVIPVAVVVLALATVAGAQTFQEKSQVMMGGAEYFITGYITKVEKDAYWIKPHAGDEVRVAITDSTHLICKGVSEGKEGKGAVKPGAGFRIGDCPPKVGEPVKAEISDLGVATLIRYLEQTPTSKPTSKTAELGLPQGWEGGVLAVPQGALTFNEGPAFPVQSLDGKSIGSVIATVLDADRGTAYGIVLRNEDQQYLPVPWGKLKLMSKNGKRLGVIQESYEQIANTLPPLYEGMNRITMPALRDFWAKDAPVKQAALKREIDVEVVMKDKGFHVITGESEKGFMLVAGTQADIRLRNEDLVAHEFVSPLLYNVPFRISGNATFLKLPKAGGVRIDPGQTVMLSFEVPADTKEFEPLYEVFWCNIHGKQHGEKMRGEVLIVETRGETGGG
jgi:hypothetical protein